MNSGKGFNSKHQYLIKKYEAFLQQIVYKISQGYEYYHLGYLDTKNESKFEKIDRKLIEKYNCDASTSRIYNNKKGGRANFVYYRHKNIFIIMMATQEFKNRETKVKKGIVIDDDFIHFEDKKNPLIITFSRFSEFQFKRVEGSVTVFMSNEMYDNVRANLMQHNDSKRFDYVIRDFNKLNGLPSWQGINRQRFKLQKQLLRYSQKRKSELEEYSKSFKIWTKRTNLKVFDD